MKYFYNSVLNTEEIFLSFVNLVQTRKQFYNGKKHLNNLFVERDGKTILLLKRGPVGQQ